MRSSFVLTALFAFFAFTISASAQATPGTAHLVRFRASNPGTIGQVIEAVIVAPATTQFLIKEAFFRTETEEECVAIRDFSTAVPVPPDRASMIYDPAGGVFRLKNSNSPAPRSSNCRVLILDDGKVDGNDFLIWQRNVGSAGLAEVGELMEKESTDEGGRSRVTEISITFDTVVLN